MGNPVLKFAWSLSGNYPPGVNAWNGQPLAVMPAGTYFTPNVLPSAENLNWMFGTIAADLGSVEAWVGTMPALNWTRQLTTSGFASPLQECGAWDAKDAVWLIGAVTVSGTPLIQLWKSPGVDDADDWVQIGTNTLTTNGYLYTSCSGDGQTAGTYWFVGTDNSASTNNNLEIWYFNGTSWAQPATGTFAAGANNKWYGVEIMPFLTYEILAVAGAGSAGLGMIISSNTHGATWTGGGIFPTGMAVGSSFIMKSNGTQALIIPRSVNLYTIYATTDGHSFTTNPGLGSILAAGNTVVGLAWTQDATGPCWLAAVQSVSGQPFWCRSADGVTWTTQTGGVTTNMTVTDMAAVGSLLVCTLADTSSGGSSGTIFSPDGGITWYSGQAYFKTNAVNTTPGYTPSHLRESAQGFMALNNNWFRMSDLAGTPPAKL